MKKDAFRRAVAVALSSAVMVAGITCTDQSTAPGRYAAVVGFAPSFRSDAAEIMGVLAKLAVTLDNVHVVLEHSDGTTAADTVVTIPPGADSIVLDVHVDLTGSSEVLDADIDIRAGTTIIFSGTRKITAVAGALPPDKPADVPMVYDGPGAGATSLVVSPKDSLVRAIDSLQFTALAKDAAGTTLSSSLVEWSVKDAALGSITTNGKFKSAGADLRGNTWVIGKLPTGLKDSAKIFVIPRVTHVRIVQGQSQTGTAGAALPLPVVFEARGNDLLGVPGATINFSVLNGGGSVTPTTATADATGRASASFTLGAIAGPNRVLANSPSANGDTAFATGVAGTANKVLFVTKPPASVGAGVVISPAVTVRIVDANNNTLTGSTASVLIGSSAGTTLGGTTTVNAVSGIATFSNLVFGGAAGNYQFKTFSPGLAADSTPVALVAGAANAIAAAAGTTVNDTIDATLTGLNLPKVLVKDISDNPVAGAAIVFVARGSGALVNGKAADTVTSGSDGMATLITRKLMTSIGFDTVLAIRANKDTIRFVAGVAPGQPHHLAYGAHPLGGAPNSDISLTVGALDRLNNLAVPGPQPSITVALAGGFGDATATLTAAPSSSLTRTAVNGTATFIVRLDKPATGYKIIATATGLAPATSNAFNIVTTFGPPASFAALTPPTRIDSIDAIIIAAEFVPAVIVRDANNVAVPGATVMFKKFAGAGASLNGLATSTDSVVVTSDVNGRAALTSWRLRNNWGTDSLKATVQGLPGAVVFTSFVFSGNPTHMEFVAQPSEVNANLLFPVGVILRDRVDSIAINPSITALNATVAIKSGTGDNTATLGFVAPTTSLTQPANSGAATWFLTIDKVGVGYKLVVTVPGVPPIETSGFDVGPYIPPDLEATGHANPIDSLEATVPGPQVILRDAFGQPVAGVNVNFVLLGGSGSNLDGNVGPSIVVPTGADGIAGFANRKLRSIPGKDSLLAIATVAPGVTDTVAFIATVQNGVVTQLVFQQQPSNSVAGEDFYVNVELRDRNGNPAKQHWGGDPILTYSIDPTAGPCTTLGPPLLLNPSYANGTANLAIQLHITGAGTACRLKAETDLPNLSVLSNPFNIGAGTPSQLIKVSGDYQSSLKGAVLPDSIVVILKDAYGNPVPGYTITKSIGGVGGSSSGSLTTNSVGRVAQEWKVGTSGPQTLSFTGIAGPYSGQFKAYIAEALVVVQQPVPGIENVAFPTQPKIQVKDLQGHDVKIAGLQIQASHIMLGGPGCDCSISLNGTNTLTTNANGEVDYAGAGLALYTGSIGQHLTGAQFELKFQETGGNGIAFALSDTLFVRAGPATHLVWETQPVNVQQNELFFVQVVAKDANDYVADGFNEKVSIAFLSNLAGATLNGITDTTAFGGSAPFFISVDKLGTFYTLKASSTGLLDAVSNAFSVVAPLHFSVGAVTKSGGDFTPPGPASCGLTSANVVYCWGANGGRQINGNQPLAGDCVAVSFPLGMNEMCPRPMLVSNLVTPTEIAVGNGFACAVHDGAKVSCWGQGYGNALGEGPYTPHYISESNFFGITAGDYHACALNTSSQAYCWGDGYLGVLGNGTGNSSSAPTLVTGERTWSMLSANASNTCGLTAPPSQAVYCWGDNSFGQLGDPSFEKGADSLPHLVPTSMIESGVNTVSTGAAHVCVIDLDAHAWCWGSNDYGGALGTGDNDARNSPTAVAGELKFSQISSGFFHTCAIDLEGGAWCWGNNDYGQLGTGESGSGTEKNTPQAVRGGLQWSQIYAGKHYTCGVTFDEDMYCWGANTAGEVGIGTLDFSPNEPHKVTLPGVPCSCEAGAMPLSNQPALRAAPRPAALMPRPIRPLARPRP